MYHMYRTDNFSLKTENVRIYKHRFTIKKLFGGGVAMKGGLLYIARFPTED